MSCNVFDARRVPILVLWSLIMIPADLEVVPEATVSFSNKYTDDFPSDKTIDSANLYAKDEPRIPPPITRCLQAFTMICDYRITLRKNICNSTFQLYSQYIFLHGVRFSRNAHKISSLQFYLQNMFFFIVVIVYIKTRENKTSDITN